MEEQQPQKNNKTLAQYLIFWVAQQISILGSSIVQFAGTWWITSTSENPIFMALFMLSVFFPQIIVGLFAGVLVDRYPRRLIIIIADSYEALVTLILIGVFWNKTIQIGLLIVLLGVRHIGFAFHNPAVNAIIPMMVPDDKLSRINGISSLTRALIGISSPFLGAIFLEFFSLNDIFWIDVFTYIIGVIPLFLIKIPELPGIKRHVKGAKKEKPKNSFVTEFKEGFRTIKETKGLPLLISTAILNNFLLTPINVLLSYYILYDHGGTATDYALVSIFPQVGMILGSILMSVKKDWKKTSLVFILSHFFVYVPYIALGIIPRGEFIFIGIGALFFMFALPILNGLYMLFIQRRVPLDKQGRVISLDFSLSAAASPIAMVICAPLASVIGNSNIFLFSGLIGFIYFTIWLITGVHKKLNFDAIPAPVLAIEEPVRNDMIPVSHS